MWLAMSEHRGAAEARYRRVEVVSRILASWNQLSLSLCHLDDLRRVAQIP